MECFLRIFIIVVVSILAFIAIFKVYILLTTRWDKSPTCLVGQTIIVTGANTGIGFYTAQDFAKRSGRVILACRNANKAEEARKKIVDATGNPNVTVKIVDLASLESVRKFAEEINATEEKLDILVNNAGAAGIDHVITEDGLSLSMQTNYFGPFLLTVLLIDLLKKSASGRIVNLSSTTAHMAKLNIADLNAFPTGYFGKFLDYANSKLCIVLFTNELARKLKGTGVCVNSLHPGAVDTEITRRVSTLYGSLLLKCITKIFYKKPGAGAQTSIYVAVSKDLNGISGEYFAGCEKASMPKAAQNEGLARKLWEKSEEFVKLTPEEKQY